MSDESKILIEQMAALGQESRFRVFRHLMTAGPDGISAGALAEAMGIRPNTLSTHLGILSRCELIRARRDGRTLYYSANIEGVRDMLAGIVADCCNGHPEVCGVIDDVRVCS